MTETDVRALFFDFDGLLIDTEVPAFRAWSEVYSQYGRDLTLADWADSLGTIGGLDPLNHLEELLGAPLEDRDVVIDRRRQRKLALVAEETFRPGVESYLERALELNISVAIVSSDHDEWITSNLARLGRADEWTCISCANGDKDRAKPLPHLYKETLEKLGLEASEAIAFEDSPNGIAAAKAAGLFCVAVPNDLTRALDLRAADLYLNSFEDKALDEILRAAVTRR
jgi:HAD superfamily hydrolase (TIGR01509 family)